MTFALGTIDWNALSFFASLFALGYALFQYSEWKKSRKIQAEVVAPAMLDELFGAWGCFSAGSESLRQAVKVEGLGELVGRVRSYKFGETAVLVSNIDKLELFGGAVGRDVADAASAIFAVNALLEGLANFKAANGVLEPIVGEVSSIVSRMEYATEVCRRAVESLAKKVPGVSVSFGDPIGSLTFKRGPTT